MRSLILFFYLILFAATNYASANGLDDLNNSLNAFTGQTPIQAEFNVDYVRVEDEGEKTKLGKVSVILEANSSGLSVQYNKQVLERIEQENQAKIKDEEADTPTLNAIDSFDTQDLNNALNGAGQLRRTLSRAIFKGEKLVNDNGMPLRELQFEMPLDAVIDDKQTRTYVDKFSAYFTVLIADDGTPIKTTSSFKGKGRAYLVISLKAEATRTVYYQKYQDRLLRISTKSNNKYDSTFGQADISETTDLIIISDSN